MPVYRFRLKDAAGNFRNVAVSAADEAEAEAVVQKQEQKKVSFVIDPKDAAELEKRLKEGTLTGRDKARLFSHQQDKPYTIEKAKEES